MTKSITLRIVEVGSRPLDKHLLVYLPDGTLIPNTTGLEMSRPGKVTIELEPCTVEVGQPPSKAEKAQAWRQSLEKAERMCRCNGHITHADSLLEIANVVDALASSGTPAARWSAEGQPDPHDNRYDCERAGLVLGYLTDDELANAAFMNYDHRPPLEDIIAGKAHSPLAYMTAVKDRIRWLSRKLVEAQTQRSEPS